MTLNTRIKSYLSQPRLVVHSVLLAVFAGSVIREVLYWLPKDAFGTSLNYWAFTDWLIDYSQGFIRRGLSGEIWRLIPAGVPPLEFVAVLSWVLLLAVIVGFLRLLARSWKALHPLTVFGLLFLPSLLEFYLHDHNGLARKEILGYCTVLLHLLVVEKTMPLGDGAAPPEGNLRGYLRGWLPVAAILLPAIVLVHEGNFLLFVPLHALITWSVLRRTDRRGFLRSALWTGLLYLPAALAFGAVYLSGTPSYSVLYALCQKWNAAGAIREGTCRLPPSKLSGSTLPASFEPMSWTLARAASLNQFFISQRWKDWIVILPALGLLFWYTVRQAVYSILRFRLRETFSAPSAARFANLFFGRFFLIPLLFALPVYASAWDYGRWFTVACVNCALVALSANLPVREFASRRKAEAPGSAAAPPREFADPRRVFYAASTVVCLLALVLWLPHYCLFACEIVRSPFQFFDLGFFPH
jgi:hypothetical protein